MLTSQHPSGELKVGLLRFDQNLCLAWTAGTVETLLRVVSEHIGLPASVVGYRIGYPELGRDVRRALTGGVVARDHMDHQVRIRLELEGGQRRGSVVALVSPMPESDLVSPGPDRPEFSEGNRTRRHLWHDRVHGEGHARLRMARMVHGDLQPTLAAALLRLDDLIDDGGDPPSSCREVRSLLAEAMELTRAIPDLLVPPALLGELTSSLHDLSATYASRFGLDVEIEITGPVRPVAVEVQHLLHEAARELLFNVVKHAEASTAQICLVFEPNAVRLYVRDQGRGLKSGMAMMREGFGLREIRNRLRLVDGTIAITSEHGNGTHVTVWVPTSSEPAGKLSGEDKE